MPSLYSTGKKVFLSFLFRFAPQYILPAQILTNDDDFNSGLLGSEAVDPLAVVDPRVALLRVADLQEVFVLPVTDPGNVIDWKAILQRLSLIHI